MRIFGPFLLVAVLLAQPSGLVAQDQGGPLTGSSDGGPAGAPDTAGLHLKLAWQLARRKRPDAQLVQISGRTDASGRVLCNSFAPFQDGWRFTFFSPKTGEYLLMAECDGKPAGPLQEIRDEKAPPLLRIEGSFIDSDEALKALAAAGVSLDPRKYKVPPKRPFSLKLAVLADEHFAEARPVLWTVSIGNSSFLVDAVHRAQFDPRLYGVDPDDLLSEEDKAQLEANLAKRPEKKKARVHSALSDYDKVMEFARGKYPGSELMAIEGFVDAWGGSPCIGPGDGWAYYFFPPKKSDASVVFACKGDVGPGSAAYVPVDRAKNQPVSGRFVDSGVVIERLLKKQPDAMNESLNRQYVRHGTLRLLNYKAPPYPEPAFSELTMFWVLELGNTRYTFDARNGRLLFVRE